MTNFDDIRPYRDEEVHEVLHRLLSSNQLLDAILLFRWSHMPAWIRALLRPLLRFQLALGARNIRSVEQFQRRIKRLMDHAIKTTTTQLTSSGLEQLDLTKPHLFISNHRDIALDPAFVNYILHTNGQDTVQIAIGDNLLSESWVSDVMRLNRCFVVKRSAETKREKLANSKQLSAYIQHTLHQQGDHIWIAQREGRAKDGIDRTNAALISMLAMSRDKQQPFAEFIRQMNIVPVSIAYEFDPCDVDKATELTTLSKQGEYVKSLDEDMRSIKQGITGNKGRVHLHFSAPLSGDFGAARDVADAIDQQIISNYRLMDSNLYAYQALSSEKVNSEKVNSENGNNKQGNNQQQNPDTASEYFNVQQQQLSTDVMQQLLQMYANPVIEVQKLK